MFNQGLLEQASLCHQALLYFSSVWCSKNFFLWAEFLELQHALFYSVCLYIWPKTDKHKATHRMKSKNGNKKRGLQKYHQEHLLYRTAPLGAIQDLPGT